jgi:hypothetical protein
VNVQDREDALVARLHALAPQLDGEPDPAFRAATRARLVAMAAVRTPAPEPASRVRRLLAGRAPEATRAPWRTRLTAGIAGAALTVTAAAALVAMAADAQPGDVLYGVKRGTEQTQLALAGDSRGPTLLDFASTRLHELESLVDAPSALPATGAPAADGTTTVLAAGADPALLLETLATMDQQTSQGAEWMAARAVTDRDDATLTELDAWAAHQTQGLAALRPFVPDAAGSAVGGSLALLSDITARSDALEESLACAAGPAVQGADALGPLPAPCTPAPAAPAAGDATGVATPSVGAAPTTPDAGTAPSLPTAGSGAGGSGGLPTTPSVPGLPGLTTPVPGEPSLTVPLPSVSLPGSGLPPVDPGLCLGKIQVGNHC